MKISTKIEENFFNCAGFVTPNVEKHHQQQQKSNNNFDIQQFSDYTQNIDGEKKVVSGV